jgi:hypothetical protein
MQLELSPDHAAVLQMYLERAVEDLEVEIASTDSREYRDKLRRELRSLHETLKQLPAGDRGVAAG